MVDDCYPTSVLLLLLSDFVFSDNNLAGSRLEQAICFPVAFQVSQG